MKSILLNLANLMTLASGDKSNTDHVSLNRKLFGICNNDSALVQYSTNIQMLSNPIKSIGCWFWIQLLIFCMLVSGCSGKKIYNHWMFLNIHYFFWGCCSWELTIFIWFCGLLSVSLQKENEKEEKIDGPWADVFTHTYI